MASLTTLLGLGVVGVYTHVESTMVFATRDADKRPLNVFTLLVTEDRDAQQPEPFTILSSERIRVKSLPGWTFGIARYTCLIADLLPALAAMAASGELPVPGQNLVVGKLRELPEQFVAPDFGTPVPWNKVLKNNFWNGSYIFEWSDAEKTALQPLFEDSRRLQELSAGVGKYVPMALAALSDRLGNVAVQVPVTAMMSAFHKTQAGAFTVDVAWHPKVPPRDLRASCELEFDSIISGYAAAAVQAPQTILPVQPGFGMYRGIIWDDLNEVIMTASGPGAFIRAIGLNMQIVGSELRRFSIPEPDGSVKTFTIGVSSPNTTFVGDTRTDDTGGRTRKRMYQDELARLTTERVFIQYKPQPDRRDAEHEKALDDLRKLIRQHGQKGAWLWDPYLNARDVLVTLFHCPHANSDLRALTSASVPPVETAPRSVLDCIRRRLAKWRQPPAGKQDFVDAQRTILNSVDSNWLGLRLEYRVRRGPIGFGFHDRFLIFPQADEGALAWSLGTSVNGMGKEHHILQRVDNGQLVRDAFLELWEQLDQPDHLIWKKP